MVARKSYPQAERGLPSLKVMTDNGDMSGVFAFDSQLLAPAQVAELLNVSVEQVMGLVHERQLRGITVGSPPQWRIEPASVTEYLDEQAKQARLMALWRGSQAASFPELWSSGDRNR